MTPVDNGTVARALLCIARERSDPSTVSDELAQVEQTFASVPLLMRTLQDPGLPAQEKHAIVTDIFGKVLSPISLGLIDFLIDENQVGRFGAVARAYRVLLDEDLGIVRARVTSAFQLPQEHVEALRKGLSQKLGNQVVIEQDVDPDILGGVIVRIGDTVLDSSIAGRLRKLGEELEGFRRDTTPPGE